MPATLERAHRIPYQIIYSGSEMILRAGDFYPLLELTLTVILSERRESKVLFGDKL